MIKTGDDLVPGLTKQGSVACLIQVVSNAAAQM